MTKKSDDNWGYTFIILGILVWLFALTNLFAVIEYPQKVNVVIKEHANIFTPDQIDEGDLPLYDSFLDGPETVTLDNSQQQALSKQTTNTNSNSF